VLDASGDGERAVAIGAAAEASGGWTPSVAELTVPAAADVLVVGIVVTGNDPALARGVRVDGT
jgi:hypothetical protein